MSAERISYRDLLRDPRWQKRRLEVLQAADWRCSRCRSHKTNLQVHHRRYIRGLMPWDYTDEQLVVLCDDCHELQHLPKPTADDEWRESQIEKLELALAATKDPTEQWQLMQAMQSLVAGRSPEQVRRMERDKGLR